MTEKSSEQLFNVHIYAVCRVKVFNVPGPSPQAAAVSARDEVNFYQVFPDRTPPDGPQYQPQGLHYWSGGFAEDFAGYLVDVVGDEHHEHSVDLNADLQPMTPCPWEDIPLAQYIAKHFDGMSEKFEKQAQLALQYLRDRGLLRDASSRIRNKEGEVAFDWIRTVITRQTGYYQYQLANKRWVDTSGYDLFDGLSDDEIRESVGRAENVHPDDFYKIEVYRDESREDQS